MKANKKKDKVDIPTPWLALGSRLGTLANIIAERDDLVSFIYPKNSPPGGAAAGWFYPAHAVVNFDSDQVIKKAVHPDDIDLYTTRGQADHMLLMGVLIHEAAHAAHTKLNLQKKYNENHIFWGMMLEETRIEKKITDRRPQDRIFLRVSSKEIVIGDTSKGIKIQQTPYSMARSAILTLGRIDAGIFETDELSAITTMIEKSFGTEDLAKLRQIWVKAQDLDDGDIDGLIDCGREVAELVNSKTPNKDDKPGDSEESGEEGDSGEEGAPSQDGEQSGEEGEGTGEKSDSQGEKQQGNEGQGEKSEDDKAEGEGEKSEDSEHDPTDGDSYELPCGSWTSGDMDEDRSQDAQQEKMTDEDAEEDKNVESIIQETMGDIANDAKDEFDSQLPVRPDNSKRHKEIAEEKSNSNRGKDAAEQVFTKGGTQFGSQGDFITSSQESPTAEDRRNANQLTKALRKAQHRDVYHTRVSSMTPPGRMNVNEAARRDAQRSRGEEITATPWKQTRRRMVQSPPLTVGLSIDVSGSMDVWQRPVSSFAWALANAVRNLDGEIAAVAWNTNVAPLVFPHRINKKITIVRCRGGSHGLPTSLDALDGEIDLVRSEGVRVQVILTDGHIGTSGLQDRINRLVKAGVLVVWVETRVDNYFGGRWGDGFEGKVPEGVSHLKLSDPNAFGTEVGDFISKALSNHGR